MSFLSLRQIEKTYPDGTRAVRGIDLTVEQGEFVVLLGPSGCGKTTTLRMIAGLELPTAGEIHLAGKDVTLADPGQRDVGFVFQFYALYPHLCVRDNIGFPLQSTGVSRGERRKLVADVADRLGLTPLLDRYPRQLGGGDQQRVSLARAMVRRPSIWLMDEPLGTLDADRRMEMRDFIRAQQLRDGVTTVYVTHDQEEAMSLADRVVVMHGGLIQQIAPPAQVYDDPANLFVAHFVGSPGMNFIEGRIDGGKFITSTGDCTLALSQPLRAGPATMGIRSEFLHPRDAGTFTGIVSVDQYLGSYRNLHVETPTGPLVVRVGPQHSHDVNANIRLDPDMRHACLFDPVSGARLR